ncbi:MAG: acVLRF1 family peptidyl-tRNA hydrolase [Haloechinothrix sp.]
MRVRAVAGGGRAVEVAPERLARWFGGFAERNGGVVRTVLAADEVVVHAADGTTATVVVPFAPLPLPPGGVARDGLAVDVLVAHVQRARRVGLLLARLGAHSVGVAVGDRVERSRTDRHLVHGRSSAGGWSQQRFARRRDGQARQALRRAADDAAEVLVPELATLDAVVLGGDRRALDELRGDPRLTVIFAIAEPRVLDLGEPRRSVLDEAAVRARAVEIVLREGPSR